jgi:hypothetical protein
MPKVRYDSHFEENCGAPDLHEMETINCPHVSKKPVTEDEISPASGEEKGK